ncbi:MAG: M28 family peptidase [Flavobacteriales bacterium]|nr:M28 family peptidase [Flavobacteriales bacterium]
MKRILFFFSFFMFAIAAWSQTAVEQLKADVSYLADDKLEGREIGTKGEELAAIYISERMAQLGLTPKGTEGYFQTFSRKLEQDPHSASPSDTGRIAGRNVVGFIDNGAKTTIIIGAHYDHLGYGAQGSLYAGDPAIHNGADDNASGVAVMLQLAEKLKKASESNNYLFIAFSGEERGLWGSNFFAKEPTLKLDDVNYMINMDMVGRLNEEKTLAINGIGTSPFWKNALETLNQGSFKLVLSESGVGPSDHTSFYLKDIPVLHFFTGQHDDYHKPSDDVHKVNFDGMESIGQFIFKLISELDDEGKLAFTKTKDADKSNSPKFSVTLGVVPDYLFDGEGMRISGVKEDRPAAIAGLLEGDIVIKMGKIDITDMQSYMQGLAAFKEGDKTTVLVKRGKKTLKKKVQF